MAVGIEDIYQFRNAAREVELAAGVDEEKAHGGFDAREAVRSLLGALASPTSRTDVLAVLRARLVVEIAKREGCEGVLWGDTTTRLAEKTLGETAKGRGFSIPWRTADGDSPFGMCAAVGSLVVKANVYKVSNSTTPSAISSRANWSTTFHSRCPHLQSPYCRSVQPTLRSPSTLLPMLPVAGISRSTNL